MNDMYISTRGDAEAIGAPEAVLRGIAPDGGLYIRRNAPELAPEKLAGLDFCALATEILSAWMTGYTREEIEGCVQRAYRGRFAVPEVAPVKKLGGRYMLELFHGPTAAFKDVALSLLPQLMSCALEKTGRREDILILTATSGDTGSAALTGFCDVPRVRVVVFYPQQGISPIQRAQMTTMAGDNLGVCAIYGNFDDAQSGVKRIFSTFPQETLRAAGVRLSSANSINIGRLAPQIVYYYSAYLELVRAGRIAMGERVNFCVPTGNFGDILAGYLARMSGLPIGRLICASNENDVLTDFFNTGVYDRNRDFHVTRSPSMDILVSSNLERLLYLSMDGDSARVRGMMAALKSGGRYQMDEAAMARIRECFSAYSCNDAGAMDAIRRVFEETGYLMDPHTAVAWRAAEDDAARTKDAAPCVVLATASPYKFPASVLDALGCAVPADAHAQLEALERVSGTVAPASLRDVLNRPVRFSDVVAPEGMAAYVAAYAAGKAVRA